MRPKARREATTESRNNRGITPQARSSAGEKASARLKGRAMRLLRAFSTLVRSLCCRRAFAARQAAFWGLIFDPHVVFLRFRPSCGRPYARYSAGLRRSAPRACGKTACKPVASWESILRGHCAARTKALGPRWFTIAQTPVPSARTRRAHHAPVVEPENACEAQTQKGCPCLFRGP